MTDRRCGVHVLLAEVCGSLCYGEARGGPALLTGFTDSERRLSGGPVLLPGGTDSDQRQGGLGKPGMLLGVA